MKRGRILVVVCGLALVGAGLVGDADSQRPAVRFLLPVGSISLPPSLSGGSFGGVATDASGNLYAGVIRGLLTHVAVFDREGRFLRSWRADSFSALRLSDPVLAVGPDGLVYVAPQQRDSTPRDETVRVFRPDGTPVRTFGAGSGLNEASDIEVDPAGNVYIASRAVPDQGIRDDVIVKFNPAGQVTARLAPVPGKPGQFGTSLRGLALAPDGSIYAATDVRDQLFVHLDQTGRRIPGIDASFIIPGSNKHFRDVDFANGSYYIAGDFHGLRGASPFGVAVISPEGRLRDLVAGEGGEIAVAGDDVYVTRLHALRRKPSSGSTFNHLGGDLGHVRGVELRIGGGVNANAFTYPESCTSARGRDPATGVVNISVDRGQNCELVFVNYGSPCPRETIGTPLQTYSDGAPVGSIEHLPQAGQTFITIPPGEIRPGPVVVEWGCSTAAGSVSPAYDWKGTVSLSDPSGNVLDRRTRRPVEAATVRLEFSLTRRGRFGTPSIAGFTPQVNPQVTGRNGAFAWDVAPGFWRLRITAFGYRPFTSPTYSVPPEVTGLKLALQPDPRQQSRLLDPFAGRAGAVRIGARTKTGRVAGLRLRVVRGRVRAITVRSRRFRTLHGVGLGTPRTRFRDVYTNQVETATRRARKVPSSFRIGRATFTVRRGRVSAIVLGR